MALIKYKFSLEASNKLHIGFFRGTVLSHCKSKFDNPTNMVINEMKSKIENNPTMYR